MRYPVFTFLFCVVFVCCHAQVNNEVTAQGGWLMNNGSYQQTGIQSLRGNFSSPPTKKWEYIFINTSGASNVNCLEPLIADFNLDGKTEVITAPVFLNNSYTRMYALDGKVGSNVWDKLIPTVSNVPYFYWSPSSGDLNADDTLDIIVTTGPGGVWALRGSDGGTLWYDTSVNTTFSPCIADIDNDGFTEAAIFSPYDTVLYLMNGNDGSYKWISEKLSWGLIYQTTCLADVNNDGIRDFILLVNGQYAPPTYLYAISGLDGSIIWSTLLNHYGYYGMTPVCIDINNDNVLEIVFALPIDKSVVAVNSTDGSILWKRTLTSTPWGSVSVGDINVDGIMDVLVGCLDGKIYAINSLNQFTEWTYQLPAYPSYKPIIADLDPASPFYEVLICNVGDSSKGRFYLLSSEGKLLWEYREPGLSVGQVVVADIDNDSTAEIIVVSAMNSMAGPQTYEAIYVFDDIQDTFGMGYINRHPVMNFSVEDTLLCLASACINFSDSSYYLDENIPLADSLWRGWWYFENGFPDFSYDREVQNICYSDTGWYDIALIMPTLLGIDTLWKRNEVYVFDTVFTLFWHDSTFCDKDILTADAGSSWQNVYWSTGDSTTQINISETVNLSVTVTHGYGCQYSDNFAATKEKCYVFIPNSFTPNGDNINDVITFSGNGIKSYELRIYNLLGEVVYIVNNTNPSWDGLKGLESVEKSQNTFAYYLEATYVNNDVISQKGNITLIR